jgi:hypothetical protein
MSARKHDDAQSDHDDAQTRARRREHLALQVLHRSCRCKHLTQTPTVNTAHHTTHTIPPIQAIQGTTRMVVAATRWSSPRQVASQSASQSRQIPRHDLHGRRRNTMVVAATSRKPKRISIQANPKARPTRSSPQHDGRRRDKSQAKAHLNSGKSQGTTYTVVAATRWSSPRQVASQSASQFRQSQGTTRMVVAATSRKPQRAVGHITSDSRPKLSTSPPYHFIPTSHHFNYEPQHLPRRYDPWEGDRVYHA